MAGVPRLAGSVLAGRGSGGVLGSGGITPVYQLTELPHDIVRV
ncbi:MAG: hypothetical protein AB1Z31_22245 [Desulfobacterales bacterium]